MKARLTLVLTVVLFLFYCEEKKEFNKENMIARVGDQYVTVDEFIKRAEYTIRPPYCRNSSYIHRKIVLNSIIAEKLFAMEEGDTSKIINHPRMKAYLKGRKEQAMRNWQYAKEIYDKVELDTLEVKKTFQYAGRRYEVDYVSANDSLGAYKLDSLIKADENGSLSEVFKKYTNADTIPSREIKFDFAEHDSVVKRLYTKEIKKNDLVGPIKISDNHYLLMQVKGWTNTPAITEQAGLERWKKITDRYQAREGKKLYAKYIKDLMKGKEIDFNKEPFLKLVNILGPHYLKTDKEKNEMMKKSYWNMEENKVIIDDSKEKLKKIFPKRLFTIDGQEWTVEEFFNELMVHPLVFRKNKMKNSEFAMQLQLAIMDLLTDKFLAEKAYKEGYDKEPSVTATVDMWEEQLKADYHLKNYLKKAGVSDSVYQKEYYTVIRKYLNPYVDSLQEKYDTLIEINTDLFEKTKLTRTDLVAISPNDAYPVIVPGFPKITTDTRLDYGKKMKIDSSEIKKRIQKENP